MTQKTDRAWRRGFTLAMMYMASRSMSEDLLVIMAYMNKALVDMKLNPVSDKEFEQIRVCAFDIMSRSNQARQSSWIK